MDDLTREEIARLLADATPGPWSVCSILDGPRLGVVGHYRRSSGEADCPILCYDAWVQRPDARLAAAAPDLASRCLHLLDEVTRLSAAQVRALAENARLTRDLAEARAVIQTYRAALALLEDARDAAVAARDEARAQLAAMARPGIVETTMPHTLSDVWRGRRRGE